MKVSELITILQSKDQDMLVMVSGEFHADHGGINSLTEKHLVECDVLLNTHPYFEHELFEPDYDYSFDYEDDKIPPIHKALILRGNEYK